MANLVPRAKSRLVQFFRTHLVPWRDSAGAIGLSAAGIDQLEAEVAAAEAARIRMGQARAAAQAATQTYYDAVRTVSEHGALMIQTIRNTAAAGGDPESVYAQARIPSPKKPSPINAPGKPYRLKVRLDDGGAVQLKWDCDNPADRGVMYEIQRQADGGAMTFLGVSGKRMWLDEWIPAGSAGVTYWITAVRSSRRGPLARFDVRFGTARQDNPLRRLLAA
jgi:hypothetical protein